MLIIKLFFSFLQVGLFSVGGGYAAIPLIQNQIVDTYRLMTLAEFTDLITIAEMTPGPISINSATFVGTQLAGIPGALICTLGCIIPSFFICLTLAYIYYKFRKLGGVQIILGALRPAVVALIATAGLSILFLGLFGSEKGFQLEDIRYIELFLFVIGLITLRKFKANPIAVIFGTGIIGTSMYYVL
ncbi:chromate transporter [Anaerotignum sp.]|uniref:chromate transporter n=1 Tax=Anaerotignum sp. TaxID=2039241 RepID=UPI0033207EC1